MHHFGTDGIRGHAGVFPINEEGAWRLGLATALVMGRGGSVVVGRDTRPSGPALAEAVLDGLAAGGCAAVDLGVLPTPAVSYHVQRRGAAAGVVISASHNAAPENGFKLFGPGGAKVSESVEEQVERVFIHGGPPARGGRRTSVPTATEEYLDFVLGTVPPGLRLDGLKLAVDCGCGATCETTPEALRRLGAHVTTIHDTADGARINDQCGSQHPQAVRATADACGASVGLAHDGDGDRVTFVDEARQTVNGDRIIGLCARAAAARGELASAHVVGTVLTNIGLEWWLREQGLTLHRAPVGDRNVWERMIELGADIGGEPSGHLIFRRLLPTDDALLTALQLLAVVAQSSRPMSELAAEIPMMPQAVRNLKVTAKPAIESVPTLHGAVDAARELLNGSGRLIVRYSGTEALARIMAEGPDVPLLDQAVAVVESAFDEVGLVVGGH